MPFSSGSCLSHASLNTRLSVFLYVIQSSHSIQEIVKIVVLCFFELRKFIHFPEYLNLWMLLVFFFPSPGTCCQYGDQLAWSTLVVLGDSASVMSMDSITPVRTSLRSWSSVRKQVWKFKSTSGWEQAVARYIVDFVIRNGRRGDQRSGFWAVIPVLKGKGFLKFSPSMQGWTKLPSFVAHPWGNFFSETFICWYKWYGLSIGSWLWSSLRT